MPEHGHVRGLRRPRRSRTLADGATVLVGGFGPAGQPVELIEALIDSGATRPDRGQQQRRQRRHRTGRADPRGPGAQDGLLVPAAVGLVALRREVPRRRDRARAGRRRATSPSGSAPPELASARSSPRPATARRSPRARRSARSTAADYVLEYPIRGDVALVGAHRADRLGNLVYRKTARNFGPIMAAAATTTVVQVGEIVAVGGLDPETRRHPVPVRRPGGPGRAQRGQRRTPSEGQ